ncbi:hypothetical protein IP84_09085 [beta proteobacterium AAP99]|nr:hypothetical protein IP84_09085 [beta proteobacterium AAP99]
MRRSPDCFWAEGLDPPAGSDWALALNPQWLGRALNVLVRAAGEAGLLVFDAEQQVLVLPNGTSLRPSGVSDWRPWAEEALGPEWLSNQHFRAEQHRLVLPWLERWGFKKDRNEGGALVFTRSTEVGRQTLQFASGREGDTCIFVLSAQVGIDFPEEMQAFVQEPWWLDIGFAAPTGPLAEHFRPRDGDHPLFPGHIVAHSPQALAIALSRAAQWLEADLLPLLNACSSRAGLLAYPIEQTPGRPWIRPNFALLALARLERVPDFDRRAAEVMSHMTMPEIWLQRALAPIRAWNAAADGTPGREA